jgi:hypothetical protein
MALQSPILVLSRKAPFGPSWLSLYLNAVLRKLILRHFFAPNYRQILLTAGGMWKIQVLPHSQTSVFGGYHRQKGFAVRVEGGASRVLVEALSYSFGHG